MPSKLITAVKVLFATSMVLGLWFWVHTTYGWATTLGHWSKVSTPIIIVGAAMVLLSHFIRVARVYYAFKLKQSVRFKPTLAVSLVHNTVSFLLPMRLGELALPALGRHQLAVDVKYGMATLFLIRLFDAHVLLCILVFFAGNLWLGDYIVIVPIALLLALPLGVSLLRKLSTSIPKLAFAGPLLHGNKAWISLYGYTVVLWVVKLFALAVLASYLGELPIDHAWIATIIADASALSPITGFANAGTFELAFTLPLLPLGYTAEPLIQTAVNVHLFIFVINICVGIFGFVLLESKRSHR